MILLFVEMSLFILQLILYSSIFNSIYSLLNNERILNNRLIKNYKAIKLLKSSFSLFMSDNEVSKFKYDASKIRNFSIIAHIGNV